MNILITGGAGFLGARLARTPLAAGKLSADSDATVRDYIAENPQAVRVALR